MPDSALCRHCEALATACDATEAERSARIIEIQQAIAMPRLDRARLVQDVVECVRLLTGAGSTGVVVCEDGDFPRTEAGRTDLERAGVCAPHGAACPIGECMRTALVVRCDEMQAEPCGRCEHARAGSARSALCMPLLDGTDVIGAVALLSSHVCAFGARDEQARTLLSGMLSAEMARSATFEANRQLLDERTATLTALRAAEERFRVVTEQIREVLFETDPDGRVTFLGAAWKTVTGTTADATLGADLVNLALPQDRQALLDALIALVRGERDRCIQLVRYRHAEGNLRWLEVRARLRIDKSGRLLGTTGTLNDVTERLDTERQRMQSQKLEAIGQLAAGIAHEINTPTQYVADNVRFAAQAVGEVLQVVAALRRVADACARDGAYAMETAAAAAIAARLDLDYLVADLPAALGQALEGLERIAEIVRGVKAFSHTGEGGLTPTDLNHQLESAVTVARNEWCHVAGIIWDLDPSLPLVSCRVGEISQVLLSIIVNAAQAIAATAHGCARKGQIRIASRHQAAFAEIRITDDGGGIADALQPRVFDPFFTTRPVGIGTGQGLAVAHGVVESHGGTIAFETEVGVGTTFVVRLPLAGPAGIDVGGDGANAEHAGRTC